MQYRIKARALVFHEDKLLLVRHESPHTGDGWWAPPGGRLEGGESLFECAQRETLEETGLSVDLGQIAYLQEFYDPAIEYHYAEAFIVATAFSGTLTIANVVGKPDERYIKEARFLSRAEIGRLTVYPGILKGDFWEDVARGFPIMRYLGLEHGTVV